MQIKGASSPLHRRLSTRRSIEFPKRRGYLLPKYYYIHFNLLPLCHFKTHLAAEKLIIIIIIMLLFSALLATMSAVAVVAAPQPNGNDRQMFPGSTLEQSFHLGGQQPPSLLVS